MALLLIADQPCYNKRVATYCSAKMRRLGLDVKQFRMSKGKIS
jgi:hypothetical protein